MILAWIGLHTTSSSATFCPLGTLDRMNLHRSVRLEICGTEAVLTATGPIYSRGFSRWAYSGFVDVSRRLIVFAMGP